MTEMFVPYALKQFSPYKLETFYLPMKIASISGIINLGRPW
jgi:hypothetical protein